MKNDIKDNRMLLVQTGVYSLIGGIGFEIVDPKNAPAYIFMKVLGVITIFYYAYTWSKFDILFKNLGLGVGTAYPILKGKRKTEYSEIYRFTLPKGLCLQNFLDKQEAIENALGREVDIKYTYKEIVIEVYNSNNKIHYDYDDKIEVNGEVAFPVGYDRHENLITCNLSKGDDNTHMLIGSTSGGGKSILLKVILTFLITKKIVDLYLFDFKGSEFAIFSKCSCIKQVCNDPFEADLILETITSIMKNRYKLFTEKGVRDIWDYNKKFKRNKMNHIVIVIDEASELGDIKDCQRELERLSSLGRAAGLNILLCTQRPDAKVVSSRVKNNFSVIAGLKTNTDINSRIIIDNDSLSKLRGRGHCIFKYQGTDTELQTMYITDDKIRELIKPFEVNKPVETKIKSERQTQEEIEKAIENM